jgi:hypothetical protein
VRSVSTRTITIIHPSNFLTEDEVLRLWPILSRAELRRARKSNPPGIEYYAFAKKNGGPSYTARSAPGTGWYRTRSFVLATKQHRFEAHRRMLGRVLEMEKEAPSREIRELLGVR